LALLLPPLLLPLPVLLLRTLRAVDPYLMCSPNLFPLIR